MKHKDPEERLDALCRYLKLGFCRLPSGALEAVGKGCGSCAANFENGGVCRKAVKHAFVACEKWKGNP
jgi:hypothetical protein